MKDAGAVVLAKDNGAVAEMELRLEKRMDRAVAEMEKRMQTRMDAKVALHIQRLAEENNLLTKSDRITLEKDDDLDT
ncbi:MAG: hypothetical protein Q9183_005546 [Haloplaca sp. 2 TL-2023]